MKKLLMTMMLFALMLSIPVLVTATEGDTVCGKSYMLNVGQQEYQMKFSTSPFGPGCSGNMLFTWSEREEIYPFITSDVNFIKVFGIGEFVLLGSELIFLDPGGIRLTEY